MKELLICIEALVAKAQVAGVIVNFERLDSESNGMDVEQNGNGGTSSTTLSSDSGIPSSSLHRMLIVPPNFNGVWPIPDTFIPDQYMTVLVCVDSCEHV
jgi:hypothetical protein